MELNKVNAMIEDACRRIDKRLFAKYWRGVQWNVADIPKSPDDKPLRINRIKDR